MQGFVIKGINHLGIVPKDIAKAQQFFGQILQLNQSGEEEVKDQGVRTWIFASSHSGSKHASEPESNPQSDGHEQAVAFQPECHLELLASLTAQSPIAQYLAKKGGGIHHLALEVDRLSVAIEVLQQRGVEFIDATPRTGVGGTQIAFSHPRSTGGILVELVQLAEPEQLAKEQFAESEQLAKSEQTAPL